MIVRQVGRAADLHRRGRRRPEHDPGGARCIATRQFRAGGQFRPAQGHHRQFQDVLRRPCAQHGQARRHSGRPGEEWPGGGAPVQKVTYDLRTPQNLGPAGKTLSRVVGHSRADRCRDAPDAAHAVLAGWREFGLCRLHVGRQHSKAGAGAADRQFRAPISRTPRCGRPTWGSRTTSC